MIGRYPDDRLAVIVLANTAGAPASMIEARIARVLLGIAEPTIEDLPTDEALVKPLAGTYDAGDVRFKFTSDEGKLQVTFPGRLTSTRLKYQGNNQFVPENRDDMRFKFIVDEGKAKSLDIESPEETTSAPRVEP